MKPTTWPRAKTCATVDSMVLRIDTDQDVSGWGEVCPIPHYLPSYARGVAPAIEELAPVLLGGDPIGVDAIARKCRSWLLGHPYVQSVIDIALWDLTGKACGLPVFTLLGGRQSEDFPLYHSITCIAPEDMAAIAADAVAGGMRQIQVKLGADANWEADVARLRKVRECCWVRDLSSTATGIAAPAGWMRRGLDGPSAISISCLNSPVRRLRSAQPSARRPGCRMKLDETAHDTASLMKAYELGCMDAVALKLSKFGGISDLRRARDLCLHFGAKMCIEDTWGSDIATAAALHVAASTPPQAILNVCDLSGYVHPRLDPDAPVPHRRPDPSSRRPRPRHCAGSEMSWANLSFLSLHEGACR